MYPIYETQVQVCYCFYPELTRDPFNTRDSGLKPLEDMSKIYNLNCNNNDTVILKLKSQFTK